VWCRSTRWWRDRGGYPEFTDQAVQGFGENDRGRAQHDLHPVAVVVDVVAGEFDDVGDALGVEQQEQPGDPVAGRQGVVVQEPACVGPAFLPVVRAAGAFPPDGTEGQAVGVPVGD
jgi:hypothetical protein